MALKVAASRATSSPPVVSARCSVRPSPTAAAVASSAARRRDSWRATMAATAMPISTAPRPNRTPSRSSAACACALSRRSRPTRLQPTWRCASCTGCTASTRPASTTTSDAGVGGSPATCWPRRAWSEWASTRPPSSSSMASATPGMRASASTSSCSPARSLAASQGAAATASEPASASARSRSVARSASPWRDSVPPTSSAVSSVCTSTRLSSSLRRSEAPSQVRRRAITGAPRWVEPRARRRRRRRAPARTSSRRRG